MIKYDDIDLMDLFNAEETSLTGFLEDGEVSYERFEGDVGITLFIHAHESRINVFLEYQKKDFGSVELKHVTELRKKDKTLEVLRQGQQAAVISFDKSFRVDVEEQEASWW